jgi:hypothetical protein
VARRSLVNLQRQQAQHVHDAVMALDQPAGPLPAVLGTSAQGRRAGGARQRVARLEALQHAAVQCADACSHAQLGGPRCGLGDGGFSGQRSERVKGHAAKTRHDRVGSQPLEAALQAA